MKLLDRYVLRSFLEPFFMSFAGFIFIWLIIDLNDNASDFLDSHASFKQVFGYYVTQVPAITLLAMPITVLLALLFSLSRMSRTNEIISMLGAGHSVVRVMRPLIISGILASAFCLWLNWEQAPHAEGIKKVAMAQIKRGKKATDVEPILAHLFRDRQNNRTWYVKQMRPGTSQLKGVHITQQDSVGRITRKWYTARANYDPNHKTWTMDRGMIIDFTPEGDIEKRDVFTSNRVISDFSETPWRVSSSELNPQGLSIPELRDYLKFNFDFPAVQLSPYRANLSDRFAYALSSIVIVFIAGPLGIVYNRRGVVGAVATAIFIFFGMIMLRSLVMALAKGYRVEPTMAPWVPDIVLGLLGMILLWFRSTNRDFPTFESLFKKKVIAK